MIIVLARTSNNTSTGIFLMGNYNFIFLTRKRHKSNDTSQFIPIQSYIKDCLGIVKKGFNSAKMLCCLSKSLSSDSDVLFLHSS